MKKIILIFSLLLFCGGLHAKATGEIVTFAANPDKGFYWEYAIYLPSTIDKS